MIAPSDHPLATYRFVDAALLRSQVWVLRELGSGTRAYSDQFITDENLTPKRTYIFNSSQSVKEAVLSGLGIAMLSRWIVSKELETGELRELPMRKKQFERHFSIIRYKEGSTAVALRVFVQRLLAANG
ncbi:LysR substrate-binding domain-containing protein [Paenibacillus sp. sgz302251]|uniref:LysR substrate-binding domain-containing protein n=1 Tax=Paenibacillus sp. sgz302251 TaxID=3414493 RepID=UPI003C7ACBC7